MPTAASAKKFTIVPSEIWAALRLKPSAPVHWEVQGDEVVMRPAEMRTAAKAHVAKNYRQSLKDAG